MIDWFDSFDYVNLENVNKEELEKYEQKYIRVNTTNFKKDQFDVIFDLPEAMLSEKEYHEHQIENSIWGFLQSMWNIKEPKLIFVLEKTCREIKSLMTLISDENLNQIYSKESELDEFKLMAGLGNI